jgi:hypothetical protein
MVRYRAAQRIAAQSAAVAALSPIAEAVPVPIRKDELLFQMARQYALELTRTGHNTTEAVEQVHRITGLRLRPAHR